MPVSLSTDTVVYCNNDRILESVETFMFYHWLKFIGNETKRFSAIPTHEYLAKNHKSLKTFIVSISIARTQV